MIHKRGLSEVITTLIFILLAIIAIGIVWYIFNNLSNQTQDQINSNSQCIGLDIRPVGISGTDIQVTRGAGTATEIGGVKISPDGGTLQDCLGDIPVGTTKTCTLTGILSVTSVTVVPYFIVDEQPQTCGTPSTYP
ncbi:MAG: hypothetical protein Q7S56_01360 [Nanoarchaeota archaeon]|nr:hypothetical protein [Nanoarchaeota archaeon]